MICFSYTSFLGTLPNCGIFQAKTSIFWVNQAPLTKFRLQSAEVESSRTSLASRRHFEVLGLGLETSSPRKLPCPRLEDRLFLNCWNFVDCLKKNFRRRFLLENNWKFFFRIFFFWKKFLKTIFFGELLHLCPWFSALASSIPVLGLERVCPRKGCPWPRIFFVSLALASSLVFSTPPLAVSGATKGTKGA